MTGRGTERATGRALPRPFLRTRPATPGKSEIFSSMLMDRSGARRLTSWRIGKTGSAGISPRAMAFPATESSPWCRMLRALGDTRCGLVRIRPELDRWWLAPDSVVKVNVIDELAGVQPGLTGSAGSGKNA